MSLGAPRVARTLRLGMGISWSSIPSFSNAARIALFILKRASLELNLLDIFWNAFKCAIKLLVFFSPLKFGGQFLPSKRRLGQFFRDDSSMTKNKYRYDSDGWKAQVSEIQKSTLTGPPRSRN